MDYTTIENNLVTVAGEIISNFVYSHEIFGESFYTVYIKSNRLTEGNYDTIPVTVSERLIDVTENLTGCFVSIEGQFRSYNHRSTQEKTKLVLSVFARKIEFLDDLCMVSSEMANSIQLIGYICKKPIYRKTPLGREITDLLIAVNRPYGKSDYIPCITWGRNARYADTFEIGQKIEVYGRIQSRQYMKKINENECEQRTAYEVSVSKILTIEE